jgi:uncharacterized protein YwgA
MKKSDLILLLLDGDDRYPIVGITRFEKLVFLVQKEILDTSNTRMIKFDFGPDRFGPLSMEIYDELDFLKSIGMVKEQDGKKYEITDKGIRFLQKKTFERVNEDMRKRISKIKEIHGKENLNDLLKYVYTTYPDFTVKSQILGRVLDQ